MAGSTLDYKFGTSTAVPPSSGQIRLDTADPTLAAIAHMSDTDSGGVDLSNLIPFMYYGDAFIMQDSNDANVVHQYDINGPVIDQGGFFDIPIRWVRGQGAIPNNSQMLVIVAAQPVPVPTPPGPLPPVPPDGAPGLVDVKEWLGLDPTDTTDDIVLQESLNASLVAQYRLCLYPISVTTGQPTFDDDLRDAIFLRTQRLAARRNSPEAVVGISGGTGDLVTARVPSTDPDILRLEGPYLKIPVA